MFQGVSHSTSQGGGAPESPRFLVPPTCTHTLCMRNNRILHGDQTKCEENFTGSNTNVHVQSVCDC